MVRSVGGDRDRRGICGGDLVWVLDREGFEAVGGEGAGGGVRVNSVAPSGLRIISWGVGSAGLAPAAMFERRIRG